MLRLRLWPKTGIDPAWPILFASCRPTIKTGTAGVRGDRVSTWYVGGFFSHGEMKHVRTTRWLSTQHHGLQTCKFPKQKLITRASAERAALYGHLASMTACRNSSAYRAKSSACC
jgi:hypothetical protein